MDQFLTFRPNSAIHSDNGAEFKSYEYKLLAMMFDLKLSMSRIDKSTNSSYIKGFWNSVEREVIKKIINIIQPVNIIYIYIKNFIIINN